ncbi:MAG: DUF4369 domain-containing protein [Phocaeicola sp.]
MEALKVKALFSQGKTNPMKKLFFCILASICLLCSCKEGQTFKLQGEIAGLQSDTLLVCYHEPYYKLDTLVANQGRFEYTPSIDTLTIFSLLFDKEEAIPVFATKGGSVSLKGTKGSIQIEGEGDNALMNTILRKFEALGGNPDKIRHFAKQFIKENPYSYTTLYLIDQLFLQQENPNVEEIRGLLEGLSGSVEDTYYAIILQGKLGKKEVQRTEMLYNLRGRDRNGKELTWNDLRRGYTLLYVWASWDRESCQLQDSLAQVHKQLKNENFNLYGFSLDVDKEAWLDALPTDTLRWKQACNFTGWGDELVKQQRITRLPTTLLLGPDRRIRARDVVGDSIVTLVKEYIALDKKREQERAAKARVQNKK